MVFDRFSTRTMHRYCRQDVVALRYSVLFSRRPNGEFITDCYLVSSDPITKELIVKRIIGLEGDVVSTLPPYPDSKVLIPEGHAWVEGQGVLPSSALFVLTSLR